MTKYLCKQFNVVRLKYVFLLQKYKINIDIQIETNANIFADKSEQNYVS